jgi:hypothetical protein
MNAVKTFDARKLNGFKQARASEVSKLKGLRNISWLTARQLNKLAGALSVNGVERRTALGSGARNLPQPQGPPRSGDHAGAWNDSGLSAAGDRHQL